MSRLPALALALALAACSQSGTAPGLQAAMADYPPMLLYGSVHATDGSDRPRPCAPGGEVQTMGGPTFAYAGADPANPALCRMTIGGEPALAWYGIWITDWPGADQARPLLQEVIDGPSGTVRGFVNHLGPSRQYYDLMRNEGVEDIWLIDRFYHALKISHYREGYGDNNYRSVSTIWKDIPTGMLIYGTYQHISGQPVIDDPLLPTKIVPPRGF
jgi:hypothetical protein